MTFTLVTRYRLLALSSAQQLKDLAMWQLAEAAGWSS
jgi:hypothetical protein